MTALSHRRTVIVVVGIMAGLFMASMESTVVATAMPTIVSELGGLAIYSWVFSAYMLAATTTVPIYGKLSDIYGRRPLFAIAMVLFLAGSFLCGQAGSMTQLIAFRGIQGLGAGGLQPLAFIMVGEMFSLEQRARMQGVFSSVWGVSAIIGPLLGGLLVDRLSWHWVFYINIFPGIFSLVLVWVGWRDRVRETASRPAVDYAGAGLLAGAVVALLIGLFQLGTAVGWSLLALSLALLAILLWVETKAADPIIPLHLFPDRLFAAACGQGLLAGWAMFGAASFVPLFVQAVLGTSAARAGATLTPQLLGWVGASIIGSRLLLRIGYRTLALTGMASLTMGSLLLARTSVDTSQIVLMVYLTMMGIGMGLSIPAFMIAVQSTVRRRDLGTATSSVQFSRSIGGAIGVSVMGAVLSARLATNLLAVGVDPAEVSLNSLLNKTAQSTVAVTDVLRHALAGAIQGVFVVAFLVAALGLVVTALAPRGRIAQLVAQRAEAPSGPATPPSPAGGEEQASTSNGPEA